MQRCEVRQEETNRDDGSTDTADIDEQIRQGVNRLLHSTRLLAQLDRNLERPPIHVLVRIRRIVGLLREPCRGESNEALCLRQFGPARPVLVQLQDALLDEHIAAHGLPLDVGIE